MYDLNPGVAETIWNNAWFEQVKEDEELHGDMLSWEYIKREDMSWWYGEGLWMLDRWIEFRSNGWNIYKDYIEKQYEVPLVDTVVKMAIDRVMTDYDGNVVLLDIKTGASSQRHPLQLATYSDYPKAVSAAAERGIRLNEAVNNKCATQVGKVRAQQLALRTKQTIFLDFNPVDEASWVYDVADKENNIVLRVIEIADVLFNIQAAPGFYRNTIYGDSV